MRSTDGEDSGMGSPGIEKKDEQLTTVSTTTQWPKKEDLTSQSFEEKDLTTSWKPKEEEHSTTASPERQTDLTTLSKKEEVLTTPWISKEVDFTTPSTAGPHVTTTGFSDHVTSTSTIASDEIITTGEQLKTLFPVELSRSDFVTTKADFESSTKLPSTTDFRSTPTSEMQMTDSSSLMSLLLDVNHKSTPPPVKKTLSINESRGVYFSYFLPFYLFLFLSLNSPTPSFLLTRITV